MYKTKIIDAIQTQRMLFVYFKKETTGEDVTRKVAPYDVFPYRDAQTGVERDQLLAYASASSNKDVHPVLIYLDNIKNLEVLDEIFFGPNIRNLLNPKDPPVVPRNW